MKLFSDKVMIFVDVYFIPIALLNEFLNLFKLEAQKNVKKMVSESSTATPTGTEKEIEFSDDEEDDKKKKKKRRTKKKESNTESSNDPMDQIIPKPNDIWKLMKENFKRWNLDYEQDEVFMELFNSLGSIEG
jgi:flagellar basal body P-ring protein FlgI